MLNYLLLSAALSLGQTPDSLPPASQRPTPLAVAVFAERGKELVQATEAEPLSKPIEITAAVLPASQPPPAAEEPAVPAAAAAERWLLMRALQGTWPGAVLDGHRLAIWGWTNASFNFSSASKVNAPVVWDDKADQFLLNQHWVRFERSVVTSGTTEPTFGFRSDWLFGSDYRFTLPRGIFNNQFTERENGLPNDYGVDPIAFYVEGYFPTIGQGLDVKIGRYFTPFGVESLEAISSPTVSKSYAFNWAPPFTHTGVFATLTLNPTWTVAGGFALGNDIFIDPAVEGRFVGFIRYTHPNARDTVTFGTSVGRGKFNEVEGFNHINVFDLVWTHLITDRLSYNFEVIYGYQTNVPTPGELGPEIGADGNPVVDEQGNLSLVPKVGTAHWGSLVHYLFYTFTPRLTGMARLEFFDDFDGSRTGFEGLYTAVTLGLNFKPCPSVWIRPELRYDYNGESQPFEGKNWLFTAATDVVLRW